MGWGEPGLDSAVVNTGARSTGEGISNKAEGIKTAVCRQLESLRSASSSSNVLKRCASLDLAPYLDAEAAWISSPPAPCP